MTQTGDEYYLGLLDELAELHIRKSSDYGTPDDPLANLVAVATAARESLWRYPRRRAQEKLARIESLERQGRHDELEEEHLEAASLLLCAEALRRRALFAGSAEPRLHSSSAATGIPGRAGASPEGDVLGLPHSQHPETGLRTADATTLFAERLRELADDVDGTCNREASEREIADALRTAADLIGPEALAEGPYVAPCAEPAEVGVVAHAAQSSCKTALFRSDQAVAEMLSRRFEAAGREEYERRRTASAVAGDEPARLRDAQRGDDGRVRA